MIDSTLPHHLFFQTKKTIDTKQHSVGKSDGQVLLLRRRRVIRFESQGNSDVDCTLSSLRAYVLSPTEEACRLRTLFLLGKKHQFQYIHSMYVCMHNGF
ncbi:hypothetical protein LguiA_001138 [Lonicera macranthoides]